MLALVIILYLGIAAMLLYYFGTTGGATKNDMVPLIAVCAIWPFLLLYMLVVGTGFYLHKKLFSWVDKW